MDIYEPELGQEVFGQPYQKFECPEYIIALLQYLEYEIELTYDEYDRKSPFRNTGNKFSNETFEVHAYSWDEEVPQPYNFKYKDIIISWYKWLGRGTTINREVTPEEAIEMFDECMKSIRIE